MDQYIPHSPVPPANSIKWYFTLFDENLKKMIESVEAHNQADCMHLHRDSSVSYSWILAHTIEHGSYHGGQIVRLHEMFKKMGTASLDQS